MNQLQQLCAAESAANILGLVDYKVVINLYSDKDDYVPAENIVDQSQLQVNALVDAFGVISDREFRQWSVATGILGVRQYSSSDAFSPMQRVFDTNYASITMHDHPNYQGMSGLAELAMTVNGHYYRSRHNDYRHKENLQSGLVYVTPPAVPENIQSLPTGVAVDGTLDLISDTQARYYAELYTQNSQDVDVYLAYAELWFQLADQDAGVPDAGDSFRHAEIAGTLANAYIESTELLASGHKNRLENRSVPIAENIQITVDGEPVIGNAYFRINVKKIGNFGDVLPENRTAPRINIATQNSHDHTLNAQLTDQQARDLISGAVPSVTLQSTDVNHTHEYVITWNGGNFVGVDTNTTHQHDVLIERGFTGNLPFDKQKAIDGTIDETNRFKLVRDLRSLSQHDGDMVSLIDSRQARFECPDLERLCEMCPGLDGEGAFLHEEVELNNGEIDIFEDRDGGVLNAAYYNHTYRFTRADAAGRQTADRGFNDPNLFVAKTTDPDVINGYSYMFPLEILLKTSLENWNPHNIPEIHRSILQAENDAGHGSDQSTPYSGQNYNEFFLLTPYALYGDSSTPDPADTRRQGWTTDGDGNAVRVWAAGQRIFTPDNSQRLRFPVYPLSEEYSFANCQFEHFKSVIKGVLKRINVGGAETITDQEIDEAF